jgi:hypothetical protein
MASGGFWCAGCRLEGWWKDVDWAGMGGMGRNFLLMANPPFNVDGVDKERDSVGKQWINGWQAVHTAMVDTTRLPKAVKEKLTEQNAARWSLLTYFTKIAMDIRIQIASTRDILLPRLMNQTIVV